MASRSSPTCCSPASCSGAWISLGHSLRALAAHPGWSHTNLQGRSGRKLADAVVLAIDSIVSTDADFGARQTLYAASQDLPGNTFVGPRFGLYGRTQPTWRNWPAKRATTAVALWELSEQLTGTEIPALRDRSMRAGARSAARIAPPFDAPLRNS